MSIGKGILWGADLYKGMKFDTSNNFNLNDILPFQVLDQDEKTPEWKRAVADHYEAVGWRNVERKAGRIQRNYWLRHGKLNPSDYIINPTENQYYEAMGILLPDNQSPLEQFYPIIPTIVDVLRGEFIKRNTTFQVEEIGENAISQALEQKEEAFKGALKNLFQAQKQYELAKLGVTPDEKNQEMYQQYMQALQQASEEFDKTEAKFKSFRTTGAKWADKVVKVQESRKNVKELEVEAFEAQLIGDRAFWHLDMLDDDFRLEFLNIKHCDYHKGPNVKYVSQGDYFLWFDWMSVGDLINKYGTKIKQDDYMKLKEIYSQVVGSMVVPDYQKSHPGAYYDTSKPYDEAINMNPMMNDALLGKEFAAAFHQGPNFVHNQDVDIFGNPTGARFTGAPQMFRVMTLYWRSVKKIGWLTKRDRDGSISYMDWVTEDFKVTVEPKYDNSIIKDKKVDNLLYGEHIDWTLANDWRVIRKISANDKHTFWTNNNQFEAIYIGGDSCPFQFKGKENPFDSLPPVEGCEFSYINTDTHSLVDRLKPYQILENVAMNKVPKAFLSDKGIKLAIDKRSISTITGALEEGQDAYEVYESKLVNSDLLPYGATRETLEGLGQPALPQLINFSTVEQAEGWLKVGQMIKDLAGEVVGINRNRQGQSKASETVTNAQSNITYSETQTEKYFEQHSNLMERVRQRMLDAAQYYSTFKDVARDMYLNEKDENVLLDMIGMENLLPHYNITLKSTANMRAVMQQLTQFLITENTLPFKPSEKVSAIVSQSVPEMLELMKKGEVEAEMKEEQAHQRELELEQERRKTLLAQQEQANTARKEEKQLDADTQIEVATIRALGGMQTDNNANKLPDAKENIDAFFRQQELTGKAAAEARKTDLDKQKHNDAMMLQRETNQAAIEKEKIKGEYNLKVAKENKNYPSKK